MMKQLVLAAALFGIFSTAAIADDRYATRPPVVLSPDLTAPWINQLGGGRVRPVVYQRPVIRQQQRGLFQRRVLRQAPQATPQTISAINPGIPSIRRPIEPQYLPQMVDYDTTEKPGTIVIDTNNRFLYLVMQGGKARRYGVGVGKPGFEWAGAHKITRKTEWPDWFPPKEMLQRQPHLPKHMAGGPDNPLGARALYLGSTLYRIHGTNAPWSIGSAVSSGCIRLRNEDVVDLYDRVNVGTRVIVM